MARRVKPSANCCEIPGVDEVTPEYMRRSSGPLGRSFCVQEVKWFCPSKHSAKQQGAAPKRAQIPHISLLVFGGVSLRRCFPRLYYNMGDM